MVTLMRLEGKLDMILALLGADGGEEEADLCPDQEARWAEERRQLEERVRYLQERIRERRERDGRRRRRLRRLSLGLLGR